MQGSTYPDTASSSPTPRPRFQQQPDDEDPAIFDFPQSESVPDITVQDVDASGIEEGQDGASEEDQVFRDEAFARATEMKKRNKAKRKQVWHKSNF